MNIIGYYKDWVLVEQNGAFAVISGPKGNRKILFKGTENEASKIFVMLLAGYINENLEVES